MGTRQRFVDRISQGAVSGIYCVLRELMDDRGWTVRRLAERTGVPRTSITRWRNSNLKSIDLAHAKAVCNALEVTLDDLFVLVDADLFTPIRRRRRVIIHVGSSLIKRRRGSGREAVGSMDLAAYSELLEYFATLPEVIDVRLALHATGEGATVGEGTTVPVESLLQDGRSHIVLGSPRANDLTERIVAHLWNAKPNSPDLQTLFPFNFRWSELRHGNVNSAFGCFGPEDQCGVVETKSGNLVAQRIAYDSTTSGTSPGRDGSVNEVEAGQSMRGKDCGLIITYCPSSKNTQSGTRAGESDSIVIVASGHGGAGTLAAVRAMLDQQNARLLLPRKTDEPFVRVVSADVTYPTGHSGRNDRLSIDWRLV